MLFFSYLVINSMDLVSVICKLAMKWYLMRMCASWLCPFKHTLPLPPINSHPRKPTHPDRMLVHPRQTLAYFDRLHLGEKIFDKGSWWSCIQNSGLTQWHRVFHNKGKVTSSLFSWCCDYFLSFTSSLHNWVEVFLFTMMILNLVSMFILAFWVQRQELLAGRYAKQPTSSIKDTKNKEEMNGDDRQRTKCE